MYRCQFNILTDFYEIFINYNDNNTENLHKNVFHQRLKYYKVPDHVSGQ